MGSPDKKQSSSCTYRRLAVWLSLLGLGGIVGLSKTEVQSLQRSTAETVAVTVDEARVSEVASVQSKPPEPVVKKETQVLPKQPPVLQQPGQRRWHDQDKANLCRTSSVGGMHSCPGPIPDLPYDGPWPYDTGPHDIRVALGKRAIEAATPTVTDEQCRGFFSEGDYTWCNNAVEVDGMAPDSYFKGYSFGICTSDLWSQLMSNRYHVPTGLFDCFFGSGEKVKEVKGPLCHACWGMELSVHNVTNGGSKCPSGPNDSQCYEAPYERHRVCLSAKGGTVPTHIGPRESTTLRTLLDGRRPLSTFLKLDVEGDEWNQLEDLLASPDDQARVRTLDMEVHFTNVGVGQTPVRPNAPTFWVNLNRTVEILEELTKIFAVTGTTLQHRLRQHSWKAGKPREKRDRVEPWIYSPTGTNLQQFEVSYVNRALLLS